MQHETSERTGNERRGGLLTDDDFARLAAAAELAIQRAGMAADAAAVARFESIGYNVSTPESRAELHLDHTFIRDLRKGTARAKMAAIGAFFLVALGVLGHALLDGVITTLKNAINASPVTK